MIKKYEKGQIGFENVLSKLRYSNDKCGLEYPKFDKPSINQTIFIKATCTKFNNEEPKKVYGVIHPKRPYVRNNV